MIMLYLAPLIYIIYYIMGKVSIVAFVAVLAEIFDTYRQITKYFIVTYYWFNIESHGHTITHQIFPCIYLLLQMTIIMSHVQIVDAIYIQRSFI